VRPIFRCAAETGAGVPGRVPTAGCGAARRPIVAGPRKQVRIASPSPIYCILRTGYAPSEALAEELRQRVA